ncbi:hypothetical protein D3C87_1654740 [compost metagenome]
MYADAISASMEPRPASSMAISGEPHGAATFTVAVPAASIWPISSVRCTACAVLAWLLSIAPQNNGVRILPSISVLMRQPPSFCLWGRRQPLPA